MEILKARSPVPIVIITIIITITVTIILYVLRTQDTGPIILQPLSHLFPTNPLAPSQVLFLFLFHPHLQRWKLKLGEVKQLAYDHRAMLSIVFRHGNRDS